nr:putative peptide modification system cyclase [Chiayiivirga flava]
MEFQRAVRAYPEAGLPHGIGIGIDTAPAVLGNTADAQLDPTLAAALSQLACPGQTLFSPDLPAARRAEAETRSTVRWLTHGAYRLAGIARSVTVHEVGEVDRAPLRRPRGDSVSAWREAPWWRRPLAVAAELIVGIGLLGVVGLLALRTTPATAFMERDWVVMGDLRNLSGDPGFDDAIEEALRIALAESGFVNVVSDRMVSDTLQRMQRAADAKIGRTLGSEIALRTGARVLVLPTVADVGARLRVSVEIVDPNTGSTLFARFADSARGSDVMGAIDSVAGELRTALGETLRGTEVGTPLPEVATNSIEALKVYAMGLKAYNGTVPLEALTLFQRAVALDPEFGLAWIGVTRSLNRLDRLDAAKAASERALALRHRLPPADALYIEAWNLSLGPPGPALQKWRELIEKYPDHLAGIYTYAFFRYRLENDFTECERVTRRLDVPQNPTLSEDLYLHASCLAGIERFAEARAVFERSLALGSSGNLIEYADMLAAQRDYAGAEAVLALHPTQETEAKNMERERPSVMYAADRGSWNEALAAADYLVDHSALYANGSYYEALAWQTSLRSYTRDTGMLATAIAGWIEQERKREVPVDTLYREQQLFGALAAGYLAMRAEAPQLAQTAMELAGARARASQYPLHIEVLELMEAERERVEGRPLQSIARLRPLLTGNELYQTHSALKRAYADAGQWAQARTEAEWLATHRGRAYAERTHRPLLMALNVVDSNLALLDDAEFSLQLGEPRRAQEKYEAFLEVWPHAESIAWLRPRLDAMERGLAQTTPRA